MIELGFELNDNSDRTPLHEAAFSGDIEIAKLLIKAGADSSLREPSYFVPPIGWAIHAEQQEMVDYLDTMPMDIFTATIRGRNRQLEELLSIRPELINATFKTVRPASINSKNGKDDKHDNDWMTPLAFAVMCNRENILGLLLSLGADTTICDPEGTNIIELAENHGCSDDIISQLKQA